MVNEKVHCAIGLSPACLASSPARQHSPANWAGQSQPHSPGPKLERAVPALDRPNPTGWWRGAGGEGVGEHGGGTRK
jgi:hypothetical protein